jgi:hypothetical protein
MRAGALLTVILLLAACTGASNPPTDSPTASPPLEPMRLLASDLAAIGQPHPFSVAAATNEAEYDSLWQRFGLGSPPPPVVFDRELAIYLGMAGSSSCPEVFQTLVVDESIPSVHAVWQPHPQNQACTDDLQPQGVLLAVARSELPDQPFVLKLRAQPICATCPDHPDQQLIDPSR